MILLGVVVAGGAGAALRYLVDGLVQDRFDGAFPLGTFVVNVSGSLALGVVTGFFLSHASAPDSVSESVRVVLGVGFLGAYTTFSTWMLETYNLLRDGAWSYALGNLVGSAMVGLTAAWAGLWLGGL